MPKGRNPKRLLCCRVAAVAAALLPLGAALAGPYAYISNYDSQSRIATIDTATRTVVGTPISAPFTSSYIAVAPSGQRLYVVSSDYRRIANSLVTIIDPRTRSPMTSVDLGYKDAARIVLSPDGKTLYAAFGWIKVVDTATARISATITAADTYAVAVSPDGRRFYAGESTDPAGVVIFDAISNAMLSRIGLAPLGPVEGIDVTPSGRHLYLTHLLDHKVSVVDTQTNTLIASVAVGTHPTAVAVSPDGSKVFVANRDSASVSVIATSSNTVIATLAMGSTPVGVAFTPDGRSAYVTCGFAGEVAIVDTETLSVSTLAGMGGASSIGRFIGPSPEAAALENPQPGSFQSGIGLISGWACAGPVSVSFDGAAPIAAPQGSPRGDTLSECGTGSSQSGFGLLTNFNLLGSGQHSAQLWVNGAPLGSAASFTVTPPSGEFLSGASKETVVNDFPAPGKSTTLIWQQSQQNFAIKSVTP